MKKYLLSTAAATCLLIGPSFAADMPMPVKAPQLVCAGCNWNGFYVGFNFGGSIGHNTSGDTIALNPPGSLGNVGPGVLNPISATAHSLSPAGWLGGGQIGANWMLGRFVVGVEADWNWTGQRDSIQVNNFLASSTVVAPAAYAYSAEEKIKWLSTARARVGWTSGYTLAYFTGGVAWGGVESNYAFQATGSNTFASPLGVASATTTKTGWTWGSGVETQLGWAGATGWSAKIEYLYVDLGTVTNSFTVPQNVGAGVYTVTSANHIRDHIVRAGLNYRFGGDRFGPPPASTPGPCPTCNWTGFYAGLNYATGIGRNRTRETNSLLPPDANSAQVTNPVSDVTYAQSPIGLMGGAQLGYNWQMGHMVLGAEVDWDLARQRDTFTNTNFIASTIVVAPAQISLTDEQKLKSLGTGRARLGWADNCFLWYVTGGAAWGRIESNYAFSGTNLVGGTIFNAGPFAASFTNNKVGWTVGGGVESTMTWLGMSDRWSSKFEYLYVDLGSISNTITVPTIGTQTYNITSTSDIREHVIRFGVNYRFASDTVVARY